MAKTSLMKYILLSFILCTYRFSYAQTTDQTVNSDQYDQVRSLVSFYEYMLNNIGSPKTSTRDKDVMIKQSYKKIFLDDQVQVEDDLILDRQVITNKDIASYLKDVDFFFEEIEFKFNQIEIEKTAKSDGSFFFLVSFENSVNGITIENKEHTSTKKRFMEVNLDENTNDLKIVSVYSTKVSIEKELAAWWSGLSYGWTSIFKAHLGFDKISNPILLKIADMDSLNIANNQTIIDIEPLSVLKRLKIVDLSYTRITDISPLRYSRKLDRLNISNTPISDISALQYFDKLTTFDLSRTEVVDITPISHLQQLSNLNLSYTKVGNFKTINTLDVLTVLNLSNTSFRNVNDLSDCNLLNDLDLSNTQVNNLVGCKNLKSLKKLNVSNLGLSSLQGLQQHAALESLLINQTSIVSLDDLMDIPTLKKVHADFTKIPEHVASDFMKQKVGTVVITNSQETMNWWNNLSENWKLALLPVLKNPSPYEEDIIKLLNIDSLSLDDKYLNNGTPLKKFKSLKYLDVSKNLLTNTEFVESMKELEYLNIADSPIKSITGLENNLQLQSLILNNTNIEDLTPIRGLSKLQLLEVEQTLITDLEVKSCLSQNPNTVIIYQTATLKEWWSGLSTNWKTAFEIESFSSYEVHRLIESRDVSVSGSNITSLEPLDAFINLERVFLDRVGINNIQMLTKHSKLRSLSFTNSPLQSLEGILQFSQLESLDISNTAVDDLKTISKLSTLKHLNCSGTGVKNLKPLTRIYGLENLNISNTGIWRLDWLYPMYDFKKLICNNTKLNKQKVDDFKVRFPDCVVTYY